MIDPLGIVAIQAFRATEASVAPVASIEDGTVYVAVVTGSEKGGVGVGEGAPEVELGMRHAAARAAMTKPKRSGALRYKPRLTEQLRMLVMVPDGADAASARRALPMTSLPMTGSSRRLGTLLAPVLVGDSILGLEGRQARSPEEMRVICLRRLTGGERALALIALHTRRN